MEIDTISSKILFGQQLYELNRSLCFGPLTSAIILDKEKIGNDELKKKKKNLRNERGITHLISGEVQNPRKPSGHRISPRVKPLHLPHYLGRGV